MDVQFVVPSLGRAVSIKDKTIASLRSSKVPDSRIWVFVASKEEAKIYRDHIPEVNIVIGVLGIAQQRIFINEYFPQGTPLVSLDDDVIVVQKDGKKVKNFEGSLIDLATRAFALCEELKVRFWGVPVSGNGFFMSHECVHGLRRCSGNLYGEYAGDSEVQSLLPHSEDVEKQLKHIRKYGGLLRLNDVGVVQTFFAEGGMVQLVGGVEKRRELYRQVSLDLAAEYSELMSFKEPKKSDGSFEKFKNITISRYPSLLQ